MIGANSIKSKTFAKKDKTNLTAFSELVRRNNWETSQMNESIRNRAIILKTAATVGKGAFKRHISSALKQQSLNIDAIASPIKSSAVKRRSSLGVLDNMRSVEQTPMQQFQRTGRLTPLP